MTFSALISNISDRTSALEVTGLSGAERAYFLSGICRQHRVPVVAILPTMKAANRFRDDLHFFSKESQRQILLYPPYNILPHKHLAYHNETAAQRIATLYRIANEDPPPMLITTAGALMTRVLPKRDLLDFAELVMVDEEVERNLLMEKLISGGYFHSAIVEEPGDFSVRGGIIDIFPPLYTNPLRIEFFGDMVDTIRVFDAASQRKIRSIKEAILLPAREAIVEKDRIDHIVARVRVQAASLELPVTEARELIERVREERVFSGIEGLMPIVYPELDTLFDYVPEKTLFVCFEPGELETAGDDFFQQATANFVTAKNDAKFCVDPDSLYLQWAEAKETIDKKNPVIVKTLHVSKSGADPSP